MELKVGFMVGRIVATDAILNENRLDHRCVGIRLIGRIDLSQADARADAAQSKKAASRYQEALSYRTLLGM